MQLPVNVAVSVHSCTISQPVQGAQNTLWMCTAMEREMKIKSKVINMEMKRHSTYNVI